jgi:hypothetical protein
VSTVGDCDARTFLDARQVAHPKTKQPNECRRKWLAVQNSIGAGCAVRIPANYTPRRYLHR